MPWCSFLKTTRKALNRKQTTCKTKYKTGALDTRTADCKTGALERHKERSALDRHKKARLEIRCIIYRCIIYTRTY